MAVSTAKAPSKAKVGRPRTPKDEAERIEFEHIMSLARSILTCLRQPGRGVYDSERALKLWLSEDGIQFSTNDIAIALGVLEVMGRIGRAKVKMNAPRPGWLTTAATEAAERRLTVNGHTATTTAPEPAEGPTDPEMSVVTTTPAEALAIAIVASFNVAGRGFQGRRLLCESEHQLREYLAADGVVYDEADLPAALTLLETATLPGSVWRLLRGEALHRRNGWPAKPLPPRAMILDQVHPFDSMEYEPADIEPYLLPPAVVNGDAKPLPSRAMLLMSLHPMDSTSYEAADIEPYVV
jgi:hypothetical protein